VLGSVTGRGHEVTEEKAKVVGSTPADNPDVHLAHLLAPESLETPWFKTIFTSIKEAINPPKLPPLEVTSKPIEVPDMWGFYGGQEKTAGLSSVAIHVLVITLVVWIGSMKPVQKLVQNTVFLIAPNLKPYLPDTPKQNQMHGGGGGGTRSPLDASKGKLPKIAPRQFTPRASILLTIRNFPWSRPSSRTPRFQISMIRTLGTR